VAVTVNIGGIKTTIYRPGLPALVRAALRSRRRGLSLREVLLPPPVDGPRLHVGAGQRMLPGYENLDAYDNEHRPDYFQTEVSRFIRAELLDTVYPPDAVAEIRSHHVFEHIGILDLDRALQGWNRILKTGGLVHVEVPDFAGCARRILSRRREEEKEIFYRHLFGSQVGPGEFHFNGLTAPRLMKLLEAYGFTVKLAYVDWKERPPRQPSMFYPGADYLLPDLTVMAVKTGPPTPEVLAAEWTHVAYRRQFPNPDFPPREDTHAR
jgi:hypothetical protein